MNKLLLSLCALTIICTSCSQQKFAFRDTIKVSNSTVSSNPKQKLTTVEKKDVAAIDVKKLNETTTTLSVQTPTAVSPDIASIEKSYPNIPAEKPWIQASNKVIKNVVSPLKTQKVASTGDGSGFSIAGFVLSLVGLLIFAVPCGILAIIFGALGLKSARKGLAIAAIVIGVLDVVVGLILISKA